MSKSNPPPRPLSLHSYADDDVSRNAFISCIVPFVSNLSSTAAIHLYLYVWDFVFLTSHKPCNSQAPFRKHYKNIYACGWWRFVFPSLRGLGVRTVARVHWPISSTNGNPPMQTADGQWQRYTRGVCIRSWWATAVASSAFIGGPVRVAGVHTESFQEWGFLFLLHCFVWCGVKSSSRRNSQMEVCTGGEVFFLDNFTFGGRESAVMPVGRTTGAIQY